MGLLNKINKYIGMFEVFVLISCVITMAVILIGNVFSRQLFNNSWKFAEEVGQFLVVIITFIGTSYAARKGKHIRMSALYDILPEKGKKILTLLVSSVTSISMFYVTYLSFRYAMSMKHLGRVSPALQMPMYLIILLVTLGFFLTALQYLIIFIANISEKEVHLGSEVEEWSDTKCAS